MSVTFRSINPKNGKLHRTFEAISNRELDAFVDRSYQRFRYKYAQGHSRLSRRFEKLGYLQEIFKENRATYAQLIVQEMGKPIAQAEGEIDKCVSHMQWYIENSERFLQDEELNIINQAQTGIITH